MRIVSGKSPVIGIVRLPHAEGLALPSYETSGAAGMDLRAAVPEDRPLLILPGKRALVPTGLVLEIPDGFEGQVRPRSGLAMKHGVTCLNTPGTVDSDYRGEVKVLLVNLGDEDFLVTRGLRIAQLVVADVARASLKERGTAAPTARGGGGFGSTGTG
jgi:dUTP pyrophosphatase